MRRALVLVLVLGGAAACDDTPSCEAIADHVLALASKGSSTVSVVDRAALVKNCKAESPGNAKMRACVMRTTSLDDAKGCELRAALGK